MEWQTAQTIKTIPVTLISLLTAGHVAAQTPMPRQDQELIQRLERSEARAAELQQRLEMLERRIQGGAVPPTSTPARPAPNMQAAPPAQAQPPSAASASRSTAGRSAPGTFDVDEDAAQRALERTLTQTGALLLPTGTFEVTPSFSYRRLERTSLATAATNQGTILVNQQNQQNQYTAAVGLRTGLPYGAQVELSIPYTHARSSVVAGTGNETSDSASNIGDITLGLAKTLTRESGWKPDLIGRLAYNFGNGKQQEGAAILGGGFRQLTAELTALKRQDPLAFVGNVFYTKAYSEDSFTPGDAAGFSLRTVLAASPATSLQLGFSQIFTEEVKVGGRRVSGSNQTYGVFSFGASSVLSRDLTLVTQFGIGVGNDAPKYTFTIALPILFR